MGREVGDADLVGTFHEIIHGERLVYSWEWTNNENMRWGQMMVTVSLSDVEGGTEVHIHHSGMPAAEVCEGHRIGWNGSFDKLDRRYDGGGDSNHHNTQPQLEEKKRRDERH